MRHNKIIGWDRFLGLIEGVQRVSPWLSRQIARRAAEWPYWYSGMVIEEWLDRQVWIRMPLSFRNSVDGEISPGHLLLGAESTLRLLLLRLKQELPFQYRFTASHLEIHHAVNQSVDYKFAIEDWERIRLELAKTSHATGEFAFSARLQDGRLAASFVFHAAFELEKFLPA